LLADWIDAEQPAAAFDDQTPRTHAAIMEGCRRREAREVQRDVALAWRIENFSRAGKKFKDLDEYLGQLRPTSATPADQAAAIFKGFEKRGLVTIKERKKRDGS
jgi:hypothetical protein